MLLLKSRNSIGFRSRKRALLGMYAVWGQMLLLLSDWMTFCAVRVVGESVSVSFTMFTGAGLSASNRGTMTVFEHGFDDTRTSCVKL